LLSLTVITLCTWIPPTRCLNGWTCGNIVASVAGIAEYYYDLLTHQIVNATTLKEMMLNIPLTNGWSPGLRYGLGLMQTRLVLAVDPDNLTWTVGHGGCDYGSIALVSGYNGRFNFSLSIASNGVAGLNCSAPYRAKHPVSRLQVQ
jgi:hypothetical protein